ncbi:MAG: PP2C family protein-serine/threonine phosphatase, partial [Desulfobacterales bacterium]
MTGRILQINAQAIDPAQKSIQWVRAGHDPGIFYDPDSDEFEDLSGLGVTLDVVEDWIFEEYSKTALKKGQIIFLCTDGLKEARNSSGEMFGQEPIYDIIRKNESSSAS